MNVSAELNKLIFRIETRYQATRRNKFELPNLSQVQIIEENGLAAEWTIDRSGQTDEGIIYSGLVMIFFNDQGILIPPIQVEHYEIRPEKGYGHVRFGEIDEHGDVIPHAEKDALDSALIVDIIREMARGIPDLPADSTVLKYP
ncbi:MAG TPA: hypothetical protein VD999_05880 [Vitreimonas sp.]|nr:hypothetical protein [Vitreimonas sp.]